MRLYRLLKLDEFGDPAAPGVPPLGRSTWTMLLIADELIRFDVVDYITDSTVCDTLNNTKLKPWHVKEWCIPETSPEFVAKI